MYLDFTSRIKYYKSHMALNDILLHFWDKVDTAA